LRALILASLRGPRLSPSMAEPPWLTIVLVGCAGVRGPPRRAERLR
jgi:hypothetical protein